MRAGSSGVAGGDGGGFGDANVEISCCFVRLDADGHFTTTSCDAAVAAAASAVVIIPHHRREFTVGRSNRIAVQ